MYYRSVNDIFHNLLPFLCQPIRSKRNSRSTMNRADCPTAILGALLAVAGSTIPSDGSPVSVLFEHLFGLSPKTVNPFVSNSKFKWRSVEPETADGRRLRFSNAFLDRGVARSFELQRDVFYESFTAIPHSLRVDRSSANARKSSLEMSVCAKAAANGSIDFAVDAESRLAVRATFSGLTVSVLFSSGVFVTWKRSRVQGKS